MANLVRHMCDFSCSPKQSTFIKVLEIEKGDKGDYVKEIDLYITEKYTNGTFNSCSQVSMPSTGQLALDLMCGMPASRCSPKNWFYFMGDAAGNRYVPFQINYLAKESTKPVDGFIPLDPKVVPCNEKIDVSFNANGN